MAATSSMLIKMECSTLAVDATPVSKNQNNENSLLPPELVDKILNFCPSNDWNRLSLVNRDFNDLIKRQQTQKPPLIGLYIIWSLSSTYKAINTYSLKPWDNRQLIIHKATIVTGEPKDDSFHPWWIPQSKKTQLHGDCWIFNEAKWIEIIKRNDFFEADLIYANEQLYLANLNGHKQSAPHGVEIFVDGDCICGNLSTNKRVTLKYWQQVLGPGHHHLTQ